MDPVQRSRDIENKLAIGGMRNPLDASAKIPNAATVGSAIFSLLYDAAAFPSATRLVDCMLSSQKAEPLDEQFVSTLRDLSLKVLTGGKSCPFIRTAKANTPLSADVIWAWGQLSGDPDAETLASWLRAGAPLGFASPIPTNGIFPSVKAQRWEDEAACGLARSIQGWANHPSASQYSADLQTLVQDAINKGFCSLYNSVGAEQAGVTCQRTGRSKESQDNLGPPGIGKLCNQGERIILPNLEDAIEDALHIFRQGGAPSFLAIDIKDAFHNVPIGADKAFTAAAFEHNGQLRILVYDVLVFGCMSSPTVWGRCAALLGRSHAAINPAVRGQVYVDDPLFTFDSDNPEHRRLLGVSDSP